MIRLGTKPSRSSILHPCVLQHKCQSTDLKRHAAGRTGGGCRICRSFGQEEAEVKPQKQIAKRPRLSSLSDGVYFWVWVWLKWSLQEEQINHQTLKISIRHSYNALDRSMECSCAEQYSLKRKKTRVQAYSTPAWFITIPQKKTVWCVIQEYTNSDPSRGTIVTIRTHRAFCGQTVWTCFSWE